MTATPSWFGPAHQLGWLHIPDGNRARAGVLLVPPLGSEQYTSYPSFRLLAERLEAEGFAVLRFDYEGTGHSAGDLQMSWPAAGITHSVRSALEYLASTGLRPLAAVGMRLGAILAAAGADQFALDALVLWDPCISGRVFLREQRTLQLLSHGLDLRPQQPAGSAMNSGGSNAGGHGDATPASTTDPITDIPGLVLSATGVAELTSLNLLTAAIPPGCRVMVLPGPRLRDSDRAKLRVAIDGQWVGAVRQETILDTRSFANEGIDLIARWLSDCLPPHTRPLQSPPACQEIVVGATDGQATDCGDRTVIEKIVSLGPLGLFGIVTEMTEAAAGPMVVCLNSSIDPCSGPSRLWVDLSRQLAGCGLRVLRFDLSGLGDSPVHFGQRHNLAYPIEAIDDIETAIRAQAPDDPAGVVLVGHCSGAYHALEAGIALGAQGVCAVNPVLDPLQLRVEDGMTRLVAPSQRLWLRPLERYQLFKRLRRALPELGWRVMDAASLIPSPAQGLVPVVNSGADVLLLCGATDAHQFRQRGGWIIRPLVRTGRLRFEQLPDLDHPIHLGDGRRQMRRLLFDHVVDHFGPVGAEPKSGVASDHTG